MGRFLRRKQVAAAPSEDGVWQVPERFNFTRDVVEAFAADPLRPALTYVDRDGVIDRRTFADVATEANRWAGLLRARGLVPGDRLLVVVGKTPAWHAILLGAMKAGLVTVPCSEMLRAADLTYRAEHSGARLVVADAARAPELARMELSLDVVLVEEAGAELREHSTVQPTHDTGAEDNAFILYTSGTTKDPKGVTHTHAYAWASRLQAEHWLDARPGDLVWCTAGTGWAKSIWNVLLGPWSRGAETVIHDAGFDVEQRFELLQRLGVTVLCQAPTEYRLMAKHPLMARYDLSRLRHAVSAGEPLNPEVIAAFRDVLGVMVYDGYGQTENTLLVANTRGTAVKPGSMGLPTPGHEVAVIDEQGNEQPIDTEGDIALRGRPPSLFTGYWDAPDETNAVFRGDWYVTGDRATRDADGYLWFTGRADDVIISAAYRIGPFEVESALLEHAAVAESAAVGKPDPDRGEIVKAFVVLRAGFEPSPALTLELQDHVKAVTAPYKYPREIEFVTELPKTASGKIRRVELRERERSGGSGAGLVAAAAPAAEAAQAEVRARDAAARASEILALEQAGSLPADAVPQEDESARERADLEEARRRKSARAAAALELAAAEAAVRAERRADLERRTAEAAAEQARRDQEQREAEAAKAAAAEQARRDQEQREAEAAQAAAAEQARRDQEQREAEAAQAAAAEQARRDQEQREAEAAQALAAEQARRDQEQREAEAAAEARNSPATSRGSSPEPTTAPSARAARREEERRRKEEERTRKEEERRRKEEEKAAAEQRKRDEAEEQRAAAERAREAERRRKEEEKRRKEEERAAAEEERLEAEARQRAAQVEADARRAEEARQRAAAEERRKEEEKRRKEEEKRRKEEERNRAARSPGATVPDPGDEHLDDERPNAELIERLRAYGRREPDADPPE